MVLSLYYAIARAVSRIIELCLIKSLSCETVTKVIFINAFNFHSTVSQDMDQFSCYEALNRVLNGIILVSCFAIMRSILHCFPLTVFLES